MAEVQSAKPSLRRQTQERFSAWATRLGKSRFIVRQLSHRGGEIHCELRGAAGDDCCVRGEVSGAQDCRSWLTFCSQKSNRK
jgi:hypothetical protein